METRAEAAEEKKEEGKVLKRAMRGLAFGHSKLLAGLQMALICMGKCIPLPKPG